MQIPLIWVTFLQFLILATSVNAERINADKNFVLQQKQVLDLFAGVGHNQPFNNEFADFNFLDNLDKFELPEVIIKEFLKIYDHGGLTPREQLFTMAEPVSRKMTTKLFDIFYFAKDFPTFYKVASWGKKHLNERQFTFTYVLALMHRKDCEHFVIPPIYEIMPNYFVPTETMHEVYIARMLGVKSRKFDFNNTGYDYIYHKSMFGGPLSFDATGNLEDKVSYFREDVGYNNFYAMSLVKSPAWMCPAKYGGKRWVKRGETFYFAHQQLFARYTLERLANGMPYVERLEWNSPIKVGYNPRVSHYNGRPLYTRPDNFKSHKTTILPVEEVERRILSVIDQGFIWNSTEQFLLNHENSIDDLGKVIYGTTGVPNKKFYPSYYWYAMDVLGNLARTSSDHEFVGEALSTTMTTMRDPLFYQYLSRLLMFFQRHMRTHFRPYTEKELSFPGVTVSDFEVDKLVTYFDTFEFDITNGVPMNKGDDYIDHIYSARQLRLNHKPFTLKIKINSNAAQDAVVRVFIGPKYDSEERPLSLAQKRWAFVLLDRFSIKLNTGDNLAERTSTDSHLYSSDPEGFRSLYQRITNSLKKSEPFYIKERNNCGIPSRYQLPKGWKNGQPFQIAIIVTPHSTPKTAVDEKKLYSPCGIPRIYDTKSMGFPFDRTIHEEEFDLPNIHFEDVLVYHKDEKEINRSA